MSPVARLAAEARPVRSIRLAQAVPLERPHGTDPDAVALEELLRRYLAE